MAARIQVPAVAKSGDVIEVRILIQHPMETGYRVDHVGKTVPKNAIRTLTCRYNGVEVFRAAMSPGIAANPYLQFCTIAEASGELEFFWTDDAGVQESARQPIVVGG
jgi:sulfur-oxidizing protein SoxZ